MMQKLRTISFLFILIFSACKEKTRTERYLPASTGAINSLMVVMENELWRGAAGDKVRELFAAPMLATPQTEPIFSITQIPPQVFKGAVTHSRSVLFASLDSLSIGHVKKDVYGRPQRVAVAKGRTEEELINNLIKVSGTAITAFKENEIWETQKRNLKSLTKETDLFEEFNISLNVPSAYKVGKHEDNFIWIDRQIPKGNMNLIAYTMPKDAFSNDSTFVKDIIKMRDSIGSTYIPGPDVPGKRTFMITERAFSPYVFPAEVNGYKAAEVRGIWEMNDYPMAGPFLSYIINDEVNDRKLVLEGFLFKPSSNKRDDMLELEAIMRTIKIGEQH